MPPPNVSRPESWGVPPTPDVARPEPVIVDDVESALDGLTDLGKSVVGPAARVVRQNLLVYVAARGWPVISHADFTEWSIAQVDADLVWLVLDPLFPIERLGPSAARVRLTRIATRQSWEFDRRLPPDIEALVKRNLVGILDDAAHSGATLRHTAALVAQAGGQADDVILGASTDAARASLTSALPTISWVQFCNGSRSATHLRDACPCLPFSGRRAFDKPPLMTAHRAIEVRVPAIAFRGGLWPRLAADRTLATTMAAARRLVVERFSTALGRLATVGDLPLLGADVSAPLLPSQSATASTNLGDILNW
jgi:hypothetical protein